MAFPWMAAATIGSAAFGFLGASNQNDENWARSQAQMDFQEYMSSTAYQRSMDDMRAAGLNPMLAYKQGGAGGGAGTNIPAVNEVAPALSSAMQTRRLGQELKTMAAQRENLRADTVLKSTQNYKEQTQGDLNRAADVNAQMNARLTQANIDIRRLDLHSARAVSERAKTLEVFNKSNIGRGMTAIGEALRTLNPLSRRLPTPPR